MDIKSELAGILDEVLGLGGRAATFTDDTALLGAVPELDSMAVVAVITSIEEHFGVFLEDDELDGATFATFGSLRRFVEDKVST
ncbi:MAG: phosphopantetheine-binding protein [Rhodocyclaceae bacterium]